MTNVVSGTIASHVTLSGAAENPTTITATGLLQAGLYAASLSSAWMITNAGSILGSGTTLKSAGSVVNSGSIAGNPTAASGKGVLLDAGGSVTNQKGATISGFDAIYGTGSALTLINYGNITANPTAAAAQGVGLRAGGSVTNQSGATISGFDGIVGGKGGALTVANAGSIAGDPTASSGRGILLAIGGSVTNQAGAAISGYDGVAGSLGGALTVVNYGTISGSPTSASGRGIGLSAGGSVTNQGGATVSGFAGIVGGPGGVLTVVNAGSIAGNGISSSGRGVQFNAAGSVTNLSGATVSGFDGIVGNGVLTVVNAGSILGTSTSASGRGVQFNAGGSISNLSGATVSGFDGIVANGVLTVVNAGSIMGNSTSASGRGVILDAGGSVTNQSGASISGFDGIYAKGGALTLVNYGNIAGNATSSTGNGLVLSGGGNIANQSGASITGFEAVDGGVGGALTLVNFGVIAGNSTAVLGVGAALSSGSVTNQSGASISGFEAISGGRRGALTVVNFGSIAGNLTSASGTGAILRAGGSVTNQNGASISGYDAIAGGNGGALTVINAGSIAGNATSSAGRGVTLGDGGSVSNQSGASITGYDGIAGGLGGALSVMNAGSIAGNTAAKLARGILLNAGGSVTNQSGGEISGFTGIRALGGATVANAGAIVGSRYAVQLAGKYTNRLIIDPGASFTGTVTGGNAIGAAQVSTLELASAAASGTLSGLGKQFIDFAQTTIDSGASWTLTGTNTFAAGTTLTNAGTLTVLNTTLNDAGSVINDGSIVIDPSTVTLAGLIGTGDVFVESNSTLVTLGTVAAGETIDFASGTDWLGLTPSGFSGEILGFVQGDTIDLTGVTDATAATIVSGNTLQIARSSHPAIDLTLDPSQNYTGVTFSAVSGSSNTVVTTDMMPCFAAGTRLDTPDGPVVVEALRAGDRVLTANGPPRPIRWIGWRRLDLRRHPDPAAVRPVRILANALAPGEPRRDVLMSPDHALLIDGGLIPVRLLINGGTIRQEDGCRSVTYFHIELDSHDVLLAEGLATESYLDTGNRGMFENAGLPLTLHPEFGTPNDQMRRETESCAPFVADARRVAPVWRALARRARALGHVLPVAAATDDPALRLECGGRQLKPVVMDEERHVFALPRTTGLERLVSRATAPNVLRPWVEDRRSLGIMVRRLTLRQGHDVATIPLDHPRLCDGWWALERDGERHMRWTNGSAQLPLTTGGPAILEVEFDALPGYVLAAPSVPEPAYRAPRRA